MNENHQLSGSERIEEAAHGVTPEAQVRWMKSCMIPNCPYCAFMKRSKVTITVEPEPADQGGELDRIHSAPARPEDATDGPIIPLGELHQPTGGDHGTHDFLKEGREIGHDSDSTSPAEPAQAL